MKLSKRILFIDDSPIFIQNIKFLLRTYFKEKYDFKFYVKNEYLKSIKALEKFSADNINIDIVILNVDINYKNYDGLVLIKKYVSRIKYYFPEVKIIISTSRNENYRINQIIANTSPLGFIIENKTSQNELHKLFISIFNYEVYYPKYIYEIIEKYKFDYFEINEIEFYILYLLKQGIKTNFLQYYIPKSNSTIEKMKSNLKDKLILIQRSDDKLVKEAIKRGFLNKFEYYKKYSF